MGLSAVIALRRQNHKVVIFERYDFGGEVGASLSCASNASKFLQEWNVPIANAKPVKLKSLIVRQQNGWWGRRRREKVCRAPLTVRGVPEGVCGKLVSDAEARKA
jgi:2-polyprenyl-6-methoxyphenol hydroxylase-like FAD-dependent oxidoreductase